MTKTGQCQEIFKQNSDIAKAVKFKTSINYTDIDNLDETCIVQVQGTPTTLIHIKWDNNFKSQIALSYGQTKIRTRTSSNSVWKEWMDYAAPIKTQKFSFSEQLAAGSWIEKTIGNLTIPSNRKITGLIVNHSTVSVLQGSVTAQVYNNSQMHVCINNLSTGTQTFSGTVTVCYGE